MILTVKHAARKRDRTMSDKEVSDDICKERMKGVERQINTTSKKLDNTKETLDRLIGSVSIAKWMIGVGLPLMTLLIGLVTKIQVDSLKESIRRNEVRPISVRTGMIVEPKKKLASMEPKNEVIVRAPYTVKRSRVSNRTN